MNRPAAASTRLPRRRRGRIPPVGYRHGRQARFVHRYPTLHWVYYWLFTRTTLRFYLTGLIGILPTLFLLLTGFDSRGFQVGYASMALITAAMVIGWLNRPRLAVTSELPTRVECGREFEIYYQIRNTGRRTARSLTAESLIYYDTLRLRLRRPTLNALAPGMTATLTGGGRAYSRGRFTLPALRWDSDFPFGFWRWGRSERQERLLTVYPRYTPLDAFDVPLGPLRRHELSASADPTREAFEFAGCREYRDGDVLHHVHPRSSARLGVPVVKEFQTEGRTRTALLVETHGGSRLDWPFRRWRNSPFEAALALASAMVDALSTTDRVLELLIAGPDVHRFVSAGRVGYLEEVLDILAGIEPCREDPLDQLEPMLFDEIRMIQSVCLVLTRWNERRERLVRELSAWEIGLKVMVISRDGRAPEHLPPTVQCLDARAILAGEITQI